jgi:anti-sigma factor RsiW
VAQLIYEHEDGHRLTLGVSAEPADSGAAIEVVTFEGLTAGYWLEGALTYALVGKTSEAQLVAIATRIGADRPRGWL